MVKLHIPAVRMLCLLFLLLSFNLSSAQTRDIADLKAKAEKGDPEAQFNLGVVYDWGIGVTKSYAESGKWYLKAANQGLAEAQFQLGVRYFEFGKKAKENYTTAFSWFFKAANQGIAEAQYNVAVMYQQGRGVPANKVEAYKWFNVAASQGYKKAVLAREVLASDLKPGEIAEGDLRAANFKVQRTFKPMTETMAGSSAPPKSSGSGFFISEDGFLVTNFHVVEDANSYMVKTKKGNFPAKLIHSDPSNDLALLKVSGTFKALPIANSQTAKLGESVFTIGFPNPDMQGIEPKLTRGDISSLAGMRDDPRHFQISVPVQPGNSGGPLVDLHGNVVGIVTMRLGDLRALRTSGALPQNVNYAVKSSLLTSFLQKSPQPAKLRSASKSTTRPFEDVVQEAGDSVAIILGF